MYFVVTSKQLVLFKMHLLLTKASDNEFHLNTLHFSGHIIKNKINDIMIVAVIGITL